MLGEGSVHIELDSCLRVAVSGTVTLHIILALLVSPLLPFPPPGLQTV